MISVTIKANKTNEIVLVYKDSLGVPINITGANARMMARVGYYTPVLITKEAVITTPEAGEIKFTLDPADTIGILTVDHDPSMTLKWGVELTLADTTVIDLFTEAELVLMQSVVRDV